MGAPHRLGSPSGGTGRGRQGRCDAASGEVPPTRSRHHLTLLGRGDRGAVVSGAWLFNHCLVNHSPWKLLTLPGGAAWNCTQKRGRHHSCSEKLERERWAS